MDRKAVFSGSARLPGSDLIAETIRQQHPRLFISPGELSLLRERSREVCKAEFEEIRKHVDSLPDEPQLEFIPDIVRYEDGKVVFLKNIGDQNAVKYGLKNTGGADAARCALLYLVTGEKKYAEKGFRYMMLTIQFAHLSERSKILPEWYNSSRLAAIVAYDWLFEALTPEQRADFLVPMLKHIDFMRDPGFQCDQNSYHFGHYGERGLWWYAGAAGVKDGIDDGCAEKLLHDGYEENLRMMEFREERSGGKGLLVSIAPDYCFGWYPCATNHFLMTLRTACGIDGTKHWRQPLDFADYFNWMAIPDDSLKNGFYHYGWGDTYHIENEMIMTNFMYTHLAGIIHLYGENEKIRTLISLIPERFRHFDFQDHFPWLPFVLTGFDPGIRFTGNAQKLLNRKLAEFYPSFGLTVMRSGIGKNDTYASIKAGSSENMHQHFDELAFIIYKRGFQALDTGIRCNAPHHLAYYPQTIAHNTLLIRTKGERLPRIWYPANAPEVDWDKVCCDGGQSFMKNAVSFGMIQDPYCVITGGDAMRSYTEKCREAKRIFVYIKPDYFVIYDRLESAEPDQQKVFLLHTQKEPVLQNGVFRSNSGSGTLFTKPILPESAHFEVIGGPGREFIAGGINYPLEVDPTLFSEREIGSIHKIEDTWLGSWRIEISPETSCRATRFLTVLQAAARETPQMIPVENISDKDHDGVRFTTAEGITASVRFHREGAVSALIRLEKAGLLLSEKQFIPQEIQYE